MTVAATGPLACGKSTFVEMLGGYGAETVSADDAVHDLLAHDEETISAVVERFGEGVRESDGEGVDRKALGRVVFEDAEALRDLEDILHPRVREETDRRAAGSGARLFVAEVPLLFEGGGEDRFDVTVAVTAPYERRKAWAEERGMGEEQRRAIEERQLDEEEKARRADVVVHNDGGLDRLEEQAGRVAERLLGERNAENGAEGEG